MNLAVLTSGLSETTVDDAQPPHIHGPQNVDPLAYWPYEPNLSSLCAQGIFQADSGIANSLTGFLKPKSTKSLKCYETIDNYDSIFRS
jgi:hypothetical protein